MKGLPTTFIIHHSVDNAQVPVLDLQVQVFTRLMRERVQAKVVAHTFASGFAIHELGLLNRLTSQGTELAALFPSVRCTACLVSTPPT